MGDGPIPWQAVEMYARLNGYSDEQKETLHYHIAQMDEAFLEKVNVKRP